MWTTRQGLVSLCGVLLLTTVVTGFAAEQAQCGFIDKTGKVVIPLQFADASGFHEGLSAIQTEEDGKYGYIDKAGKLVVPPQFATEHEFSEGLAAVCVPARTK